jgi:hypothetical protein
MDSRLIHLCYTKIIRAAGLSQWVSTTGEWRPRGGKGMAFIFISSFCETSDLNICFLTKKKFFNYVLKIKYRNKYLKY